MLMLRRSGADWRIISVLGQRGLTMARHQMSGYALRKLVRLGWMHTPPAVQP